MVAIENINETEGSNQQNPLTNSPFDLGVLDNAVETFSLSDQRLANRRNRSQLFRIGHDG